MSFVLHAISRVVVISNPGILVFHMNIVRRIMLKTVTL